MSTSEADFQEIQRLKAGQDRVLRLHKQAQQETRDMKEELRRAAWNIKDILQGATISIDTKRKFEQLALRLEGLSKS